MEEFANREGEIVTGLIQRVEPRQIFIDLGRTEAVLPATEQVAAERYRVGQRLKVVILEVVKTTRGPRVIVSRSHPDLPRRLFEMEVPEIYNGTVTIKSIAREAGSRSKVAVGANQEGVDPVGCCVGLRGIRIQNIVNELNGEKIDVVMWSPESGTFIANALSPAHIVGVELDRSQGVANVVVPDRQLSLAIGKEGQNVRLAAKLTGWRIDIKSATVAEAEKAARAAAQAELAQTEAVAVAAQPRPSSEAVEVASPVTTTGPRVEEGELVAVPFIPPVLEPVGGKKTELRFAEDIMAPTSSQVQTKTKKKTKKKAGVEHVTKEDAAGIKKGRRDKEVDLTAVDEDEF
jgi:N utilization substance protein A